MRADPRTLAVDMLLEVEKEDAPCHLVIRRELDSGREMDPRDRNFCRRLTESTLEHCIFLDYMIDQVAKTKTNRMKPAIRWIIRTAACQIWFMDVPDRAAVNEAVRLTAKKGYGPLKGFVNGVLRNLVRRKETLKLPDRGADPVRFLSIRYSMPEDVIRRWVSRYGEEQTETIAASFERRTPMTVRLREAEEPLTAELEQAGISVRRAPYVADARILTGVSGLEKLDAFLRGAFTVQDVSSMIAVHAAGIRRNDRIIDLCAAPGGKSLLAADLAPEGCVLSRDLTKHKTDLIRSAAGRLGISNVKAEEGDASRYDPALADSADVVIADVPCSGLGVIGRKPDIRYRVSEEKTESLVRLQKQILSQAVRYLRPGGTLLFSTCTIDERENEDNAAYLLQTGELEPCALAPCLPEELRKDAGSGNMLQLLPGIHRCDGFFIAKFTRKART